MIAALALLAPAPRTSAATSKLTPNPPVPLPPPTTTAAEAPPSAPLPRTGGDTTLEVMLGAALLAAGAAVRARRA